MRKPLCILILSTTPFLAQTTSLDVRQRYAQMATEIFRPTATPLPDEAVQDRVARLRQLLTAEVLATLNHEKVRTAEAVWKMLDEIQGDRSRRIRAELKRGVPFAAITQTNIGPVVTVASSILKGPFAVPEPEPVIQFYMQSGEMWQLRAEAPPEALRNRSLEVSLVPAPFSTEVWLMAWGKTFGDTGSRLFARLYSFNALTSQVSVLWRADSLHGGEIEIQDSQIAFTYWDSYPIKGEPIRKVLTVGSGGLQ